MSGYGDSEVFDQSLIEQLETTLVDLKGANHEPDAPMEQRPAFLLGRAQVAIESALHRLKAKQKA